MDSAEEMNWFGNWLKKGFSFKITLPWMGEKKLPADTDQHLITKEECEKEIEDSLKKGGDDGATK